jgi:TatA/E family protein of Tat protein translocase
MGEITVILVLALIFIGPKKLPELASGLGKLIREIRKTTADVKNEIQLDEAIRKPFEELRDAVTLPPEELKRRDRIRRELQDLEKRAAEMAARQAEGLEPGAAPPAPEEHLGLSPGGPEGAVGDTLSDATGAGATSSAGATSELTRDDRAGAMGFGDGHHHHHDHDHDHSVASGGPVDQSAAAIALAAVPTEASLPFLTGTSPIGTIARGSGGGAALPPPPPPVAATAPPRKVPAPAADGGGPGHGISSELMRALRPDARKTPVVPQSSFGAGTIPSGPIGSADRSNTTQILSESDLATLASTPAPPPLPPPSARQTGKGMNAVNTPPGPSSPAGLAPSSVSSPLGLPGSTPPKPPTSSST